MEWRSKDERDELDSKLESLSRRSPDGAAAGPRSTGTDQLMRFMASQGMSAPPKKEG